MTINPKIFFLTSADLPNFRSSIQSLHSLTNNTISDQYLEDLVRSRQLVISIDPQTNKVLATSRILITADHFRVQDILTTLKLNTERELPFFYYGGHGLQEIEEQLSRSEYPYAGTFNYDVEKDVVVYISNSVVHPDIESSVLIKMFQKAIEKELSFLQSQFGRTRDSRVNLVFTSKDDNRNASKLISAHIEFFWMFAKHLNKTYEGSWGNTEVAGVKVMRGHRTVKEQSSNPNESVTVISFEKLRDVVPVFMRPETNDKLRARL